MIAHLALVSCSAQVTIREASKVSSAIQKQITRDFGPRWGVEATIDVFERLEDVPLGYWRIIVLDEVGQRGIHLARDRQPYALVESGDTWSLAASHEALEMLVDPYQDRVIPGRSPMDGQVRVEFLVEVCDPCQDGRFAYRSNEYLVSDFVTKDYYGPVAVVGRPYSFAGHVTQPREVLRGGCLSWREPASGDWYQLNRFRERPEVKRLGQFPVGSNLRSSVDAAAPRNQNLSRLSRRLRYVAEALSAQASHDKAASANAESLRQLIAGHGGKVPEP